MASEQNNVGDVSGTVKVNTGDGVVKVSTGEEALKAIFGDNYRPLSEADKARLEAEQAAKDEEMQAQFVDVLYRASGVPQKFYDAELDALFDTEMLHAHSKDNEPLTRARVDAFISGVTRKDAVSMWLCGEAGTGKTALACAIIREAVRRGVKCQYFKSHEIMSRLEDVRTRSSRETRASIMTNVTSCPLMVIDEVGRWPNAEWEKFMLFTLADRAYDNRLSAIFISNMGKWEFSEFIGDAATDRGRGKCTAYAFDGASIRGTGGELYAS